MNRLRALVLVAAACLALSACGDGDGPSREPAEPNADRMAIAEASLLTLGDFPAGWEAVPTDEEQSQESEESREEIANCMGVDYEDLYSDGSGRADSPDFTSEYDEEVSASVTVYDDVAEAEAAIELGASAEFRDCSADIAGLVMEEAADEAGEDAEIGAVAINEMSFDKFGDATAAFGVSIPITVSGFELEAVLDVVLVRVDRALISISSSGVGSTIGADELAGYVQIVSDRLTAELENAA